MAKKLPEGFKKIMAYDLQRGEFFYYNSTGGKRQCADSVEVLTVHVRIKASLPDGRQIVRYVKMDKEVFTYSK